MYWIVSETHDIVRKVSIILSILITFEGLDLQQITIWSFIPGDSALVD